MYVLDVVYAGVGHCLFHALRDEPYHVRRAVFLRQQHTRDVHAYGKALFACGLGVGRFALGEDVVMRTHKTAGKTDHEHGDACGDLLTGDAHLLGEHKLKALHGVAAGIGVALGLRLYGDYLKGIDGAVVDELCKLRYVVGTCHGETVNVVVFHNCYSLYLY